MLPVLPVLRRLEGWETRLAAVIEFARGKPYVLGSHDCFRVACMAVQALTGVDLWASWAGRYRTRRQALALVARYARESGIAGGEVAGGADPFCIAFSRLFATEPLPPERVRRGDILEYRDRFENQEQQHLGVCVGAHSAVLGEHGLAFVEITRCTRAWRIG